MGEANIHINEMGEIKREGVSANVPEMEQEPRVRVDVQIGRHLEAVFQEFALSPKEVYVPGSSTDVLPHLDALQTSHILYADTDEQAVKDLHEAGYDAVLADVELAMPPSEIDLMVLNGISVNKPLDVVTKGGYVYSDGRMGSAENIAQNHEGFSLVGVLLDEETQDAHGSESRKLTVQRDNLDPYLKGLRRTEEEGVEIRRKLRMQLLAGNKSSETRASEPLLPEAKGYVFQKV